MEEKQSRVRWNDQELTQLAAVMALRLLAEPQLHLLDAVRVAQDCLEPGRRRELKAWSLVEGRLQPKLDKALARLREPLPAASVAEWPSQTDSQRSTAEGSVDAVNTQPDVVLSQPVDHQEPSSTKAESESPSTSDTPCEAAQVHGSEGTIAQADTAQASEQAFDLFGNPSAPMALVAGGTAERSPRARGATTASGHGTPVHTASVTVDPARIEAALITALQSPAVEEALVDVFIRTMSKALTAGPHRRPARGSGGSDAAAVRRARAAGGIPRGAAEGADGSPRCKL